MEALWWILIILSFGLGYLGLVFPAIPSILMFWVAAFIYKYLVGDELSIMFWLVLIVLTILVFLSDMAITQYYVKKLGGTKAGQVAAIIGIIVGMFVYPPLGVIFVPIFLVFIVELVMFRKVKPAFYASLGSLLAFVTTTMFKVIVYTLIVVWFLLDIFLF
ncbi:DUF456 domain-containing protein [Phocicoccus pinnipedialis]|uniref:DUF456 domain-containing protein n=1 Tax=Phocicoccus pinnipedialis TaxID=110845 RepID=A0A6V7QZV4_9BACL|nr:DUF456 family protein [Jeotgalicoccus pinnipedialis]MBP1938731.1 uncharacterized protein YqgC (DUF456 family) [Jeotgalicoccus pinnipedialis]CAD2070557.1 hypothetical protein JEOPIN946_00041 [Jeotgalicoccus pinnipedialis]